MPRIGELLVAGGVLSEVAVQSALGFQRHTGEPFRLGTILLDRDLVGEESLLKALSAIHRCDYVTWPEILKASPQVVRLLPERVALRLAAVPYALEGRGVRVAFKNPSNLAAVDEVSAVTNRPVIPAVISEVRLLQALNLFHGRAIPIEFRSVLLKLERNEERRLYRSRGTARVPLAGRSVHLRGVEAAPEAAREIPIVVADSDTTLPRAYAAPFAAAEVSHGTLADAADFLPDFTPPKSLTPEELAERMWKDETAAGAPEMPVPAVWSLPRPAPAPAPASREHEEERAAGRDEIAEAALESLAERFPRSLLLVSAQEAIQGWTGRGGGLTRPRVAALRIPWGEPSIFAFVKLSGTPHRGSLSRILMPGALADLLGDRATASCAVFPVRIKDRLVAFLYADRLGAPLSDQDYKNLEVAASSLGSSLARLLLDLRKAAPAG